MQEGINFFNKHSFKELDVAGTIICATELQLYMLHFIPKVSTPGIYILVRDNRPKKRRKNKSQKKSKSVNKVSESNM